MRGFEQIPWLYDAWMAVAERGWLGRWRDAALAGLSGRVLELGCGTGRNLPRYPAAARAVAVDPFPQNLTRARARAPAAALVLARGEALPFADGAFDAVVSGLVLCSVEDPAAALAEVRRVLRPGGALHAIEHVRARRAWAAGLQDLVQPAWTAIAGGCHPNRATEETVAAAGFAIDPATRAERGAFRRFTARRP